MAANRVVGCLLNPTVTVTKIAESYIVVIARMKHFDYNKKTVEMRRSLPTFVVLRLVHLL